MFILMGLLAEIQVRAYFESQGRTHYKVKSTRNLVVGDAPSGTQSP